ncbi:MAG: hypothetical protein WBD99_08355 [Thermodesulfobacteriota bacterium]
MINKSIVRYLIGIFFVEGLFLIFYVSTGQAVPTSCCVSIGSCIDVFFQESCPPPDMFIPGGTCAGDACSCIVSDPDNDCVPASIDQCPDSNVDPTFEVSDCEIRNELLFDGPMMGCTKADLLKRVDDNSDNHGVAISDAVFVLNFLFLGAPADVGETVKCVARDPCFGNPQCSD